MKSTTCALGAALLLASTSAAQLTSYQLLPRPEQQLNRSRSYTPVGTVDWDSWYILSPDLAAPASPSIPGSVPTGRLVHAFYPALDANIGFIPILAYRRSTDGGLTWEKEQNVFQVGAGATWWTADRSAHFFTDEHKVFAVIHTDSISNGGTMGAVVMASFDQGQTWSPPLLATPFAAGPNPRYTRQKSSMLRAAYSKNARNANESGVLHLVYEVGKEDSEDVWYSACRVAKSGSNYSVQIVNPEVRLNVGVQAGQADCDWPNVAATGDIVHVCWQDGRFSTNPDPNLDQDTFTRTSRNGGKDLHQVQVRNETNFSTKAAPGWAPRQSKVAIAPPNIYTFLEDSRNSADQVHLSYSNNLGSTWKSTICTTAPTGVDLDGFAFFVQGREVMVVWRDDRNGAGNVLNQVFYTYDRQAGAGFGTPAVPEVPLSIPLAPTIDIDAIRNVERRGDVIAISIETNCNNGGNGPVPSGADGVAVFWSADGGQNWNWRHVSHEAGACTSAKNDVDTPYVAVSAYGDINLIWIDDRDCGSNSCNNVFVTGIRSPFLVDNTSTNKGLALADGRSYSGHLALLLLSSTGTTPGIPLPNGMQANVTFDALTGLGITAFNFLFIGVIDQTGQYSYAGLPNLGKALGTPVHVGGVLIDTQSFEFSGVIDPILLK